MEEARQLGDKYAPEDMEEGRKEKTKTYFKKVKPTIERVLEAYTLPDLDGYDSRNLRHNLLSLMKNLPNVPRLYGGHTIKARTQNKEIIEEYLDELENEY